MSVVAAMRRSIKEPIPAIFRAAQLLSDAVDAHIACDHASADALFREANLPQVWDWVNPAWLKVRLNVRVWQPEGDTAKIPKIDRPSEKILRETKADVRARDGYRCRYCGIPVIDADIRKIAHLLYVSAVPWHEIDPAKQHAAFQCMWLQYDHVIPNCHGGLSSVDNLVISCGLCNFGKDQYTLRQLALLDPRDRPPEPIEWDGLERLRGFKLPISRRPAPDATRAIRPTAQGTQPPSATEGTKRFFLPEAFIGGRFLYTPLLAGKKRYFELVGGVTAGATTRDGIEGCWLTCDPRLLQRRGIPPDEFLDTERS